MSIYISGVEMPLAGTCKTITIFDNGTVVRANGSETLGKAIYVPPHGKLLDRDAVILDDGPYEYDEWCKWALDQYIDAPTIIPADKKEEQT